MSIVREDKPLDAATGILNRKAFLDEVQEVHRDMPASLQRGCLLILNFPAVKQTGKTAGSEPVNQDIADDAMRHLLAIIEARERGIHWAGSRVIRCAFFSRGAQKPMRLW